jgi:16S rRNA (guanine966-N2)-methyltransferase
VNVYHKSIDNRHYLRNIVPTDMRITGGLARGINLVTGGREDIRPATDMMRQAVFSSLGGKIEGARCLDLFAGTGAYGLEALSRGASNVCLVELDRHGIQAIGRNVQAVCKSMGADPSACRVEARDVFAWTGAGEKFDLIFADPPYAMLPGKALQVFEIAVSVMAGEAMFVFEMPGGLDLTHLKLSLVKRLGKGRNDPSACFYSVR